MGKSYELPDWRKWKVEDTPELMQVQKRLAQKGLKDPWLRNEVWRFQPLNRGVSLFTIFKKGFKWGFIAFIGAVAIEKAFFPKKDDGHH